MAQLLDHQRDHFTGADESADDAQGTEEMHRPFAVFADKGDRSQVEEAFQAATQTAEFGITIFPGPVFDDFLTDLFKARPFGDHRDVAMHLAIDFDTFYHLM